MSKTNNNELANGLLVAKVKLLAVLQGNTRDCPHLTRDAVMRRMVRDWHGAEKEGNQTNVAMEYGTMNESIVHS